MFTTTKMGVIYAKIRWLARKEHFEMSLMELVDMASGSELIPAYEIITPPKSENLDQLNHLIEKLTSRHDVELKVKEKLQSFAEDSSYIGKTEEKLLERAKVAVFDDGKSISCLADGYH